MKLCSGQAPKKIQIKDFNNKAETKFYFEPGEKEPFYTEIFYFDKISKENIKTIKSENPKTRNVVYIYDSQKQDNTNQTHLCWFENILPNQLSYIVNEDKHLAFFYNKFGIPQAKKLL